MANYSVEEIYEAVLEKISKELNLASQENKLEDFINKYELFQDEKYVYFDDYNSNILIVGELSFSMDVLYAIAKEKGISKDQITHLDYAEAKHFDFQSIKGYSRYSDIIVGPNAHKAVGINGYSSLIEMIKNEQDQFPKLTEAKDSTGKLKITKTSLKMALDNTVLVSNIRQCYTI
ncbi:MAG: hypothetical protein K2G03_02490 [Bacilli bacterium]|nr:hypothetical protein [Bacilli bacterium]